ncbi:hypothetical protein J7426_07875 [Tropicibacter sp. R16_0]|uniref:hypothetical protein n=1 Tax=Tropicibacter sp. R16_0 TaxID=2821102 RepID=UPI001ADC21CC|nr:hypothetical protein [Tropicibacter sp. R16_0]MBO9450165.1 hypothetical protein [Tropicibacter sp. R16_0]
MTAFVGFRFARLNLYIRAFWTLALLGASSALIFAFNSDGAPTGRDYLMAAVFYIVLFPSMAGLSAGTLLGFLWGLLRRR